jgi:hypothetical protein
MKYMENIKQINCRKFRLINILMLISRCYFLEKTCTYTRTYINDKNQSSIYKHLKFTQLCLYFSTEFFAVSRVARTA